MPVPVELTCTPVQASGSMEVRTVFASAPGSVVLTPSLSRTVSGTPVLDSATMNDIQLRLRDSVEITQYFYNSRVRAASRDFYRLWGNAITAHSCGSENTAVLQIDCPSLTSSTITSTWSGASDKYVMVTDNKPFNQTFLIDPTKAISVSLTVKTDMGGVVSGRTLPTLSVTDIYTCPFTNPLTYDFPALLDMGSITWGETVTKDLTIAWRGYISVLPQSILTVTPASGNPTSVTLGNYLISLTLPDGRLYRYGDSVTPTPSTTLKVTASPGPGTPVTGEQSTQLVLTHTFL
ncbi:hypothetical protein H8I69_05990 [Serratia fonticola]|uniref:hypothetical protein n=1 Tax=Serratia fonticola TaxID=47917 RepID=UPI0015C668A1|nr:hypothetical protein [Serratia fonticola]MBC3378668.1 hypothetical protein [Serratia fonticola]NYA37868.1 hypothetical protein [Serratia fonticola]